METYLVTGGAGFIGSHIVERLAREGHTVRVFDNLITGKLSNLAPVIDQIEFMEGDVRDLSAVRKATAGVTAVLHQAALRAVPQSINDPVAVTDVNIGGTLNVLIAAREARVKRLIFASSSSVYGGTTKKSRETLPENPKSPYALTKLAGEHYCRLYYELHGLPTVVLRYFNVFGPRQDPASPYAAVIPLFTRALIEGTPAHIEWDGKQERDFTFVDNVVQANMAALLSQPIQFGQAYNIATGDSRSILSLYETLSDLLGTSLEPVFYPKRAGDVRRSCADISRAKQALNYQPTIAFEEGLRQYVAWYRTQQEQAKVH